MRYFLLLFTFTCIIMSCAPVRTLSNTVWSTKNTPSRHNIPEFISIAFSDSKATIFYGGKGYELDYTYDYREGVINPVSPQKFSIAGDYLLFYKKDGITTHFPLKISKGKSPDKNRNIPILSYTTWVNQTQRDGMQIEFRDDEFTVSEGGRRPITGNYIIENGLVKMYIEESTIYGWLASDRFIIEFLNNFVMMEYK